jgi:hypothetical protein
MKIKLVFLVIYSQTTIHAFQTIASSKIMANSVLLFHKSKKKKLSLLINHNKDVSEFIIYPPKNTINIYNNEYQKVPINKNFLAVDTLPNKNLHNVYK